MLTLIAIAKILGTANVAKKLICDEHVNPLSAYNAMNNVKDFVSSKISDNAPDCGTDTVVESVVDSCDSGSIFDIFDNF